MGDIQSDVEVHSAGMVVLRDGSAHSLSSGYIQRRIRQRAAKLHITARLDVELPERNHRHLVLDGTAVDGIASVELEVLLGRIGHGEVAATFKIHVAGGIGAEQAMDLCGIVDADIHGDIHVLRTAGHLIVNTRTVLEIHEFHEVGQRVVDREGRVCEDVGHIGVAKDPEPSEHPEVIEGTAKHGIEVNEDFAVGQ